MRQVAIVGGGVSGLATAYYLRCKGIPCRLFERQRRLGGLILTERAHGCLVEGGPDSWLAEKRWMRDFVEELGLGSQVLGSNDRMRRTFVARKGRLVAMPDSMRMLAPSKPWQIATTSLLGPVGKARMAMEWFRRPVEREDRSVADFVRDHFGSEVVQYLAQPLIAGVYGAAPESLSARQAIPRFVEYERRYGSILRGTFKNRRRTARDSLFLTLRGGMGSLIEALERRVTGHCEIVNDRVRELRRGEGVWTLVTEEGSFGADTVILATPAHEASRLVATADAALAELVGRIDCLSSAVVALAYPGKGFGHSLGGFGFLVPSAEGGSVAACTWVKTKFDGRSPAETVLLRAFMAGRAADWALDAEDSAVVSRTDRELRRWMGFQPAPAGASVYRWKKAMPVYPVDHDGLIRAIEERLARLPGLLLAGNGYSGLGIPDCVRRSERIAEAVAAA